MPVVFNTYSKMRLPCIRRLPDFFFEGPTHKISTSRIGWWRWGKLYSPWIWRRSVQDKILLCRSNWSRRVRALFGVTSITPMYIVHCAFCPPFVILHWFHLYLIYICVRRILMPEILHPLFLSPSGDLGIGLVWDNNPTPQLFGPTVEILFKLN